MQPLAATNDFVVKFANVNGSGSASANELFAKSFLRMGIPVSPRNIFPSNIQGLPTWYEVRVTARGWLGSVREFDAFHWHGETFNLPTGAAPVLTNRHCTNQAFAVGKHLGLQCHIEMTAEMIDKWCEFGADEIAASAGSPAVQPVQAIRSAMEEKLPRLHAVARRLYEHWVAGLEEYRVPDSVRS